MHPVVRVMATLYMSSVGRVIGNSMYPVYTVKITLSKYPVRRVTGDKLHMWFRFRSTSRDGLLLWIGEDNLTDLNEAYVEEDLVSLSIGDCLSLEIKDGRLVLRYNLGSGFAELNYNSNDTFDNGEWHTVRLARYALF